MEIFKNKTLLITGGTGSFGRTLVKRLASVDLKEIRIFSRDEKKQDDMRKKFNNTKLKFYLGDIRDFQSISNAMDNVDYIFHAAALKIVPSCEFYPLEAVKTNILGTENILEAATIANVKKIICLSTDKAVYPINAMGLSKSMMEKVAISKSRINSSLKICITRYGNVMASRGSVIPLFLKQINENIPITITNPEMTRFMMSLDEAVELVLYAFKNGKSGEIFIQKSPAASIQKLKKAILSITQKVDYPTEIIGTRHGEKLYETLLSKEEMAMSVDLGNYYKVKPDNRDLNYSEFLEKGKIELTEAKDYTSHNTNQLSVEDLIDKINNLNIIS